MMPSGIRFIGITVLLVTAMCFSSVAYCQNAAIDDIILTNDETHLIVYFTVANCFTPRLEQAILNGLPAIFRFYVDLYKIRSFWYDKMLASAQISHSIEYNLLKKEFHVTLEEREKTNHTVLDFEEAKKLMKDVDRFSVIPMEKLEKNQKYYLRIKAQMVPIRLPFNLDLLLFFLPRWEFETDWYVKEFIY